MSGRCKACDCIMSEEDMATKWPGSDDYVELCGNCLDLAEEGEWHDNADDEYEDGDEY